MRRDFGERAGLQAQERGGQLAEPLCSPAGPGSVSFSSSLSSFSLTKKPRKLKLPNSRKRGGVTTHVTEVETVKGTREHCGQLSANKPDTLEKGNAPRKTQAPQLTEEQRKPEHACNEGRIELLPENFNTKKSPGQEGFTVDSSRRLKKNYHQIFTNSSEK